MLSLRAQSFAERLRLGIAVIHGEAQDAESDLVDGRHSPPMVRNVAAIHPSLEIDQWGKERLFSNSFWDNWLFIYIYIKEELNPTSNLPYSKISSRLFAALNVQEITTVFERKYGRKIF